MDLRRENSAHQKKCLSYFAVELKEGVDSNDIPLGNGDHELANLPSDCIITDAYAFIQTVSDAATSAVATLGITPGGSELASAINMKLAGDQGTFAGLLETGTGATIYLGVTKVGVETAVGKLVVVVEYLEHTKKTGEFTAL